MLEVGVGILGAPTTLSDNDIVFEIETSYRQGEGASFGISVKPGRRGRAVSGIQ